MEIQVNFIEVLKKILRSGTVPVVENYPVVENSEF